eukprot:1720027-Ditylum_brightwellii.AAC.1
MFPSGHSPPCTTIQYTYRKAGLHELKKQNGSVDQAEIKLTKYLSDKCDRLSKHRDNVHMGNQKISEDEDKILLEMCILYGSMGYRIDELTLLDFVNLIIQPVPNESVEVSKSFVPATMDVVNRIIRTNKDIDHVVEANSLDKQRAN